MSTKTKTSSTSQQQGTATNTLDPAYLKLLNSNVDSVNKLGTSYQPYAGSDVADFTPAQIQAQNLFTGIANDNVGKSTLDASTAAAKGVAGYQPVSVTAPTANAATADPAAQIDRSSVRDVNGGLLTGVDLSKYENPYTQDVVNATSADLNNQRLMEQNQNASDATKAGAWRGNALAVTNAVSDGNWDRTLATTIANLRQAGYTQAAQNAEADLSRGFAADQGNQGVDLSVANTNTGNKQQTNLFNAGQQQQVNLANQATTEDAAKANQAAAATAAALRLQGSGQLAANSNQDLSQAATRAGLVAAVGDTQQAQQQKQLDWLYQNNYLNGQQYQLAVAQLRNQAIGLVPNQQTIATNQSGSGTGTQTVSGLGAITSSLGNLFSGLGAAAAGAAKVAAA